MNKTQVPQLVVIVLLLVFVVTWFMTRKLSSFPKPSPSGAATVEEDPSKNPAEPSQESQSPSGQPLGLELTIARDFFESPSLLKDDLRRKEAAREEAKRLKEAKPTSLGGSSLPSEPPPSLPSLQLQGIFWGEKPQVIINRQVLSIGDKIEQVEVVSVTKEGVTLSFNGQEFHLSLEESGRRDSSGGKL